MQINSHLLSIITLVTSVAADNFAILTLLNKGYELPSGETCTAGEWNTITSTIDGAAYGRRKNVLKKRNLRRQNNNDHRDLASSYFCTKCCSAFYPGTCYFAYPSCSGVSYRRDLLEEDQEENTENRELISTSSDCLSKVKKIKEELEDLMPFLSSDCQQVVASSQDFICSEVNVITSWNLWNGIDNSIIMEKFEDGGSLCRSTQFNIEAVVHDEDRQNFIEKVTFFLTGPNGYQHTRTERNGKYMMYGNSATNIFGQTLTSLGIYTVVATPNDDPNLSRTLTFTLNDC